MTDNLSIFLRGFIMGITIAAPVGPIGVLCIRRTLADGKLTGFLSGLGAATADMLYGALTAFGFTFITDLLIGQKDLLKLLGGFFLLYLGIRTFISKPATEAARATGSGLLGAYFSTLFLTITNPATIIAFIAIFSAMPVQGSNSPLVLVAGVFAGSASWWLLLSFGVSLLRERVNQNTMVWINRISGTIVAVFGLIAILTIN